LYQFHLIVLIATHLSIIILLDVLYVCQTWLIALSEREMQGGGGKLHNSKNKNVSVQAIQTYGGGGVFPLIVYLGIRCRLMVSFTPRPLYPREGSQYLMHNKLEGPQILSDVLEKREIVCLSRESNRDPLLVHPIA